MSTLLRTGIPRGLATSQGLGWTPTFSKRYGPSGGVFQAPNMALLTGEPVGSLSSGLHHARADRVRILHDKWPAITALLLPIEGTEHSF